MWDVFAWVGIVTLTVLALRFVHFAVETFLIARVGWDVINALGFWRAIPASLRRRSDLT